MIFLERLRSLCADIPKSRFAHIMRSCRAGTPFLDIKKGGKEMPRGVPLGTPGSLPAFFSGKPAGGRTPVLAFIQKGAAAPGMGLLHFISPAPNRFPGAPCCMGWFGQHGHSRFSLYENRLGRRHPNPPIQKGLRPRGWTGRQSMHVQTTSMNRGVVP